MFVVYKIISDSTKYYKLMITKYTYLHKYLTFNINNYLLYIYFF